MATLPLVPAVSQWDGSSHQSGNCTCASCARLARYAFGIVTTGGRIRACQSDQSGGTSLPDVLRALRNCFGKTVSWAAPNDSNDGLNSPPPGRVADWITPARLVDLLEAGYMAMVQGDYGDLPLAYREQASFVADHTFTVDATRVQSGARQAYIVDTIPKYGTGYDGRWIPWSALMRYAHGLAGAGRIYAAWAKPAKAATEDEMYSIPGEPVPFPVTVDMNTPVYDSGEDTSPRSELDAPTKPFLAVAESKDGKRWALYGRSDSKVRLGWVDKTRCNKT